MKTILKITLAAGLIAFLFGCGTTSTKNSVNSSALIGSWQLLNEGEFANGMAEKPLTINFDENNIGKINGFSGCNNYGGDYVAEQGSIVISNIYSTKMACPDMELEQSYLNLLDKVNRFEIKGNDLYLYQDRMLFFHFKK